MNTSPLQIAKEFAKLKSALMRQTASDLALLTTVDFWYLLRNYREGKAYQSYFEEYFPLVIQSVTEDNLNDLTLDELEGILPPLREMALYPDTRYKAAIQETLHAAVTHLATSYFYVGEVEKGLTLIAELTHETDKLPRKQSHHEYENELTAFQRVCVEIREKAPAARRLLEEISHKWEIARTTNSYDCAHCLFVEKVVPYYPVHLPSPRTGASSSWRGRMRVLRGEVECLKKTAKTDKIAFENQIKSPDDPFIGVAFDSLKAVRRIFKGEGLKKQAESYYDAHFSIDDRGHSFTGDSIGIAFGLIAYTQLLKPEVMRQERLLAGDVTFTGGVTSDGKLTPVNEETLAIKVERAFFSHVRYLVLPEANASKARECVGELKRRFPNRRLHLITAEHLSELIENHNIIRPEKVCIGQFVVRKAYKYSRMTTIQLPFLAVLIWLFLALLFPKKFNPWFDWHIARIEVLGNRFRTLNSLGQELWVSEEFSEPLNPGWYDLVRTHRRRTWWAIDTDGNGRDELFFNLWPGGLRGMLLFYSDKGAQRWKKQAFVKTGYPGDVDYKDITANMSYGVQEIIPIIDKDSNIFVMTRAEWSPPVRHQFLLFDTAGNIVSGPYLHTGAPWPSGTRVMDRDGDGEPEVYVKATNNRMSRAVLCVLDPKNLYGVSPPYDNELFQVSGMAKGSQLYYVAFPETELSQEEEVRNYVEEILWDSTAHTFHISTVEGSGIFIDGETVSFYKKGLPHIGYILDSNFIPINNYFADGQLDLFNDYLMKVHRKRITDSQRLLDSLLANTIVYYGDSIVHYPAAGIYFYKNK